MSRPGDILEEVPGSKGTSKLVIPDHTLLRRIGSGSYGEVWLARNAMGVYRAVKIVHRKTFKDDRPFERELSGIRKFEPISRSHDGFIDILHVGQNLEGGYFYYVMELGDDELTGQNIEVDSYHSRTLSKEVAHQKRLDLEECIRLGLALSDALFELHRQGLVHRDIKPSNIIFIGNIPKLADIGLVADVSEARSYVGTEGFIPPEGPGSPAADVYALGKVLYEASTGKDRNDFPDLPDSFDEFPDRVKFLEFNEVMLQACHPDPAIRYRSAEDMHEDLLVLAKGKSVRRLRQLEKQWGRVKHFTGIIAALLILVALVGYHFYREWSNRDEARQRQAGSDIAFGVRSLDSGDLLGSLTYFAEAARLDHSHLEREKNYRAMFGATFKYCPKITQMWNASERLRSVRFSPDGTKILLSGNDGASLVDSKTGFIVANIDTTVRLRTSAFSPDGRYVAAASEKGKCVYLWGVKDCEQLFKFSHPTGVLSTAFSPDGRSLITGAEDGQARIWSTETGKLKTSLGHHSKGMLFACYDATGTRISTTGKDNLANIWDATTGKALFTFRHESWVANASFSPDGMQLVTSCYDHKAYVWDLKKGDIIMPALDHDDLVYWAEFSPDGRQILTASLDHTARFWRAKDHRPADPVPLLRHSDRVTFASFNKEGNQIVTSCTDGTVRIWDLAGEETTPAPDDGTYCHSGQRFLTRRNQIVQITDAISGAKVSEFLPMAGNCEHLQFCENGNFLGCLSEAQTNHGRALRFLTVVNCSNGRPVADPVTVPSSYTNLCCSDNGRYCFAFEKKAGELWDSLNRSLLFRKEGLPNINAANFSPNSEMLGIVGGHGFEIWNIAKSTISLAATNYPFFLKHAEFSPDSSLLVVCGADMYLTRCPAEVFDVRSGKKLPFNLPHDDGILFASFSPDGTRIVTASEDDTAVIWDARTGKQVTPTLRHHRSVQMARFSPDGKWVVTACFDGSGRIWDVQSGNPITPPLSHMDVLMITQFIGDGGKVLFQDYRGRNWVWTVPDERKPSGDLALIAEVLTGDSVSLSGPDALSIHHDPRKAWSFLHSKYPQDFAVTGQDVEKWHRTQSALCLKDSNTNGSNFHLNFLANTTKP